MNANQGINRNVFKDTNLKLIPLSQGEFAIVDDIDYEPLKRFRWCCHNTRSGKIAERNCHCIGDGKWRTIMMHRQIMSCPKKFDVDHKYHNTL